MMTMHTVINNHLFFVSLLLLLSTGNATAQNREVDSVSQPSKDRFWTKPQDGKSIEIPNGYTRKNWNLDIEKDTSRIKIAKPYDLLDREYAQRNPANRPKTNDTSHVRLDARPYDLLDRKYSQNKGNKQRDTLSTPTKPGSVK